MDPASGRSAHEAQLGGEALEQIARSLSDLYNALYEERPGDARASLTGNMLAFVFEGGLSTADEWLLRMGRVEQLEKFRRHFFEVVGDEMVAVVADLTGLRVTYSFYAFDPQTRTTHAIFVLDLAALQGSEQRRAVLNWSEQVRRNARRLREEHVATRQAHKALTEQFHERRVALRREIERSGEQTGSGDG